jgi:hypothetical protein
MNPRDESLFFTDPQVEPSIPGDFSTLYLLRRDAKSCLEHGIQWPGAMCVMAGIDLLGKFLDGSDSVARSGERFRTFAGKYLHLSASDPEALYQLRNALLHSFGLFSATKTRNYQFQLRAEGNRVPIVEHLAKGIVKIDLLSLHHVFEAAVSEYQNDLRGQTKLQKSFDGMFPRFGKIPIR